MFPPLYPKSIFFDISAAIWSIIWFHFTAAITVLLCGNSFVKAKHTQAKIQLLHISKAEKSGC